MDWTGCAVVESVPGKMSGVPVLRHTRMPADSVIENFADLSPEEIAEDFDLDLNDVRAVLIYAGKLAASAA